jgi:hypothetical protein
MITAPETPPSPVSDITAMLGRLTSAELRDRIAQLQGEMRATRALLRSVAARERALARREREVRDGQ